MIAEVNLWGTKIGVIHWNEKQRIGEFQYSPEFISMGIEVSPITMPLREAPYIFNSLNWETYKGLPGLLADVLPDKFGNAIIDQWLAKQNRKEMNPVERLCYVGSRGMGALEFKPSDSKIDKNGTLDVKRLVELASQILSNTEYAIQDQHELDGDSLSQIMQVGTSAGGARAKAIINWNPEKGEIRSGAEKPKLGFEPWLIKFDGVSINKNDHEKLADPQHYGRIEYAYHLLATKAGIEMTECRLLEESGRAHFMTRRFDRVDGRKVHISTLCAMGHYDFNMAGATSYEQAFQLINRLKLEKKNKEQLFLRMVFNVIFRNQDDHTKNIAFMMDRSGKWSITPAYDMTYSYKPNDGWTATHQMTINNKSDHFSIDDLLNAGIDGGLTKARCKTLFDQVFDTVNYWSAAIKEAKIKQGIADHLRSTFRDTLLVNV